MKLFILTRTIELGYYRESITKILGVFSTEEKAMEYWNILPIRYQDELDIREFTLDEIP